MYYMRFVVFVRSSSSSVVVVVTDPVVKGANELVAEPRLECTRRGAPQGGLGKIRNRKIRNRNRVSRCGLRHRFVDFGARWTFFGAFVAPPAAASSLPHPSFWASVLCTFFGVALCVSACRRIDVARLARVHVSFAIPPDSHHQRHSIMHHGCWRFHRSED